MEAESAAAIGVEDLDPAGVLARIADAERRDREVQLEKLQLAYHWCVLHPATAESGTATWGDAGLPGLSDCDASLGWRGDAGGGAVRGRGARCRMGVSTQSAMGLMADALDLRHRLPQLWAKVEAWQVAPYKTRRVAADTRSLPYEAARWVDEQLAARVDGFGLPTIERLVALAAARFAPEEQAEKEQAAGSQHHVTLSHPRPGEYAGTSYLEAAGDTAGPDRLLRPGLRGGQAARPARRHRRLRDPQGQGPRHHRRAAGHPRPRPTRPGRAAGDPPPGADAPLRPRLPGRPRHPPRRRPGRRARSRSSAPPPST